MNRKAKSGAVSLVFSKLNALFGAEVSIDRSHIARMYEVNRFDCHVRLSNGNDAGRLYEVQQLLFADLLTSGWKRVPNNWSGSTKFVSEHKGRPVALYIDNVSDFLKHDVHFGFSAGNA